MVNYEQFKNEFETCFKTLHKLTAESFRLMDEQPALKDEMISLWKSHILTFISYTYSTGEKHNNKDVFKAITKALMFGK